MTWPTLLTHLLARSPLTREQAAWAMNEIVAGRATDAQIAGLAVALRAKGESPEELAGLADALLAHSTPLHLDGDLVDIVGSGGDQAHTVNVSTMAAIVVAACGVRVAKHGGRSASSLCGAADLLEELGIDIEAVPRPDAEISFLFAPRYHPALRHASKARRELGVPTVFNFLAPLTNPARPTAQAVGVANRSLAPTVAEVLARRGCSSIVFRGDDGLDELTTCAPSQIWLVRHGAVTETRLDPADLGIRRASPDQLRGGDAVQNARVARELLDGKPGPVREIVLLNAAAALVAAEGAPEPRDLTARLCLALTRAAAAIDDGRAAATLERWILQGLR
ncbi:MAG: anthranilate phosphoribosyltransferase [Nonomuraea sp.]|nr:anthranilate phosphoribosyltransferase [Nonomuraea sp.]